MKQIKKSQQDGKDALPRITVSIVSHGNTEKILSLLESLATFEQANSLQVVITDNLGNDFPQPDESPWNSLIVMRNERPQGFARNHNQAFAHCAGDYFCMLNPDVVFEQEIFSGLIELIENGAADIVAPLIVDSFGVIQDSFRAFPTPKEIVHRRLPNYHFSPPTVDQTGLVRPDWVAGIFLLMKAETYRKLDGFDEKFRLYFEDVDLCARARLAGLKIVVSSRLRVRHDAERASHRKPLYMFWHLQSAIRFFRSPVYSKLAKTFK